MNDKNEAIELLNQYVKIEIQYRYLDHVWDCKYDEKSGTIQFAMDGKIIDVLPTSLLMRFFEDTKPA